ncbi:uncharacterized protein BDZ99DRAFT_468343 [Mytilinidion resinicola]|uniref:Uncharacterized protein n=1 Tax=Mytilinidion resinicola TaxID=574789 RepID=A0A6A6Y4D9_9PEZI|nr:uncharacterized protein BDZ99DRAFT_468343 [Mytilinidion resinicola]KAF2803388.1 hypothetical protein BDZ99DRAFT_468343 [Mytilinidion resinicola]
MAELLSRSTVAPSQITSHFASQKSNSRNNEHLSTHLFQLHSPALKYSLNYNSPDFTSLYNILPSQPQPLQNPPQPKPTHTPFTLQSTSPITPQCASSSSS